MFALCRVMLCSFAFSFCSPLAVEELGVTEDEYRQRRLAMVDSQLESRDITNSDVLKVMRKVPRHLFMPEEVRHYAYADSPVSIGERQTISQPYIVALMTQTAEPKPQHRALEIGTGSGYQAAVLAELVREVYTVEIIPTLAARAKQTLSSLNYRNVVVRQGDGYQGWSEKAPFDIILVTAAAPVIPRPLVDQLAEGGRLVMPVGSVAGVQTLTLVTKRNGRVQRQKITGVRFVPMTGEIQRRR